jgi:hypothetical protein
MNRNTLKGRIERIELERSPPRNLTMVVRRRDDESGEEALARAGVQWAALVAPEPCATTEEWLKRCAPTRAKT